MRRRGYMNTCVFTCMISSLHVCVCACERARLHICVHACTRLRNVCNTRKCLLARTHAVTHTHTCARAHTHTHTPMHTQNDCAYLEAAGIKGTDDLLELEIEDITEMAQALSLATKKRLTRFAQLSPQVRLSLTRV